MFVISSIVYVNFVFSDVVISTFWFFPLIIVSRVGLWSMIMAFPGHTHLCLCSRLANEEREFVALNCVHAVI